ncbi:MAG: PD-(D/E)XK nuclease family protein, partial [Sinobacteraceae bacterium]|nr:PD-(D/E)XK nuclease family protein [Nevskiaceae bacterium]
KLHERMFAVRFGSAVHAMLETWIGDPCRVAWAPPGVPCSDAHHQLVRNKLRQYGLVGETHSDPRISDTAQLIARTLHTPLPDIGPLVALEREQARAEMEFMFRLRGNRRGALVHRLRQAGYLATTLGGEPAQSLYGLMQGFIDLVVECDGRYYVLDYKTNHLGDSPSAYAAQALEGAVGRARYDLQYLIYAVALHRHLRHCLGSDYHLDRQFGGVQYLFVRAMDGNTAAGVFCDRPEPAFIEALDVFFDTEAELV